MLFLLDSGMVQLLNCSIATFLHKGSGKGDENEELNNYAFTGAIVA